MPSSRPAIIALWHGQHLLTPAYLPKRKPLVAMVSRSADAELNALMLEKFGIEAVRGSGGRDNRQASRQGRGASALIALKKSLAAGKNVAMIADIPPRHAARRGAWHRSPGAALRPAAPAGRHRHQPPQGAGEELGQDHHQPAVRPLVARHRRADLRAGRRRRSRNGAKAPRNDRRAQRRRPPRPTVSWMVRDERSLGARHARRHTVSPARAAYPLVGPYVAWRTRRGKEDRSRRRERYGVAGRPRPPKGR